MAAASDYRVMAGSPATIYAIQKLTTPGRNLIPAGQGSSTMQSDSALASRTGIAAATISSGSGLIYDVTLINPLTGETLESSSAKAMPLQLNYFYTIPSGTKVVVVPLDVDALGDGSGG